jgi:hypothetical protein
MGMSFEISSADGRIRHADNQSKMKSTLQNTTFTRFKNNNEMDSTTRIEINGQSIKANDLSSAHLTHRNINQKVRIDENRVDTELKSPKRN